MRRPDPDSVRWAIAASTSPELVALVLSIVVLLVVTLLVLQAQ
jgi:Tfp pilus assembly protein PilX